MSHKKFLIGLIISVASIFFFPSCKNNIALSENAVNLGENWTYTTLNPFENNVPFFILDDNYLSNLHLLVSGHKGTIWLKKTFVVPEKLQGEDISCYLGRITLADKTYINGALIGNEGFFPPHVFSAWNTTRFYEIPEALLNEDENTLIVEIYVDGEGSIVSDPFIGLHNEAKKAADWERFWNCQINLLFAFFMFIISIYHIIIYYKNRDAKESLWFAFVNIATALYMLVFYISELPGLPTNKISFLWFQKIFSSGMPFLLIYMISSFVNSFLGFKPNKFLKILSIIFLVVPLAIIFAMPSYTQLRSANGYIQILLLPPLIYVTSVIVVSVFKHKKDAIELCIGFIPFIFAGVLDLIVHNVLEIFNFPYMIMIGWQIVIITLLFILANRFSNARTQVHYLNKHLKDEVKKQTKELSESNSQLTDVVSELNEAKEKSERDIKMAGYVQQSIYQHIAPFVDGWDIAFKFQPKSGVSGDLYDFIVNKNTLNGLALFDVSGQGLAAGLVALLSKSVIDEEFNKNPEDHLSTVLKNISQSISEKKGNIDNTLKGALLRFTGDKVEYINAGGPIMFLRSAKTGKCSPVKLANTSATNDLCIGRALSANDFKVIGFKMAPGDSLILFSNSLANSKDINGLAYSEDRIARIFAGSGNGNAQFKLNSIIADYEQFKHDTLQDDDLTVIVVQKQ